MKVVYLLPLLFFLAACGRPVLSPANYDIPKRRAKVRYIEKQYRAKHNSVFGCDKESAKEKARKEGHPVVLSCQKGVFVFYPDGTVMRPYLGDKGGKNE